MPAFKPKIYIKDTSKDPIYKSADPRFYFSSRMLPGLLMSTSIIVLTTQVIAPLFFFKTQTQITKPMASTVLGVASGFSEFKFEELRDGSHKTILATEKPKFFNISISKLKIENAVVEINSTNLSPDSNLGHYNGSSLPGNKGNSFIYGHSVLPWFYNPKNYKTIFSTLNDLYAGDEIKINYDGRDYIYKVESKELLKPDAVQPLSQYKPSYLNESTITLMTCWPAGSKAKRLLIHATLVS